MELVKTTLNDIAGYEKIKREGAKLIDVLKNSDKYLKQGARIPRGLLLSGHPGIGKTMFARAIATESGLKTFTLDGAIQQNENSILKDIKAIFDKARESAPSIIIIDEIEQFLSDSRYGRYQSDLSRNMTKLMLTEIDGVANTDGVFIICTTNEIRALPISFVRSGRMDKKIQFKEPNLKEREEILALYIDKNKDKFVDIHIKDLAKVTEGFNGADIKTAINEALIESISFGITITDEIILKKFDEIRFESIDQSSGEPNERVIYHELGHALCNLVLNREYSQITISDSGQTRGATISEKMNSDRESDRDAWDKLENSIVVSFGGVAAEIEFLGIGSAGCSGDMAKIYNQMENCFSSGMFGFDNLFYFQKQDFGGIQMLYTDAGKELYGRKLSEYRNKAINIVRKYKEVANYFLPILKKRRMLSSNAFKNEIGKAVKELGKFEELIVKEEEKK